MTACCPCDDRGLPLEPVIPAGLAALPRQAMGFPEYRLALLSNVRRFDPLLDWRARGGDDLGVMVLEWWAYVLDVVGFYDQQIANDSYLRTAGDAAALRRIVGLIGYRPRPAVAAEALLAAIADAGPDVLVPTLTAFRSEAIGSEPPQVFETMAETTIAPGRNRWTLAPVRPTTADGSAGLTFDIPSLRLVRGAWAVVTCGGNHNVAQVTDIAASKALDGVTYAKVTTDPQLTIPSGTSLSSVKVRMPTASAGLSRLAAAPIDGSTILLDAIYPQIAKNQDVVLIAGTTREVHNVQTAAVLPAAPPPSTADPPPIPTLPVTALTFAGALDSAFTSAPGAVSVHFQLVDGGRLVRPATTRVQRSDLAAQTPLAGPAEPLDDSAAGPLLVQDRDRHGVVLDGTVSVSADGTATLHPTGDTTPFARPLVAPVEILGNILRVVRGETVGHEVMGSGDAKVAMPSFKLKKKPLTYLPSAAAASGRKSTLEVRVNGILWREVESFYGTSPGDDVYIVRQNEEQDSFVTFWRLPTGINNVTARYRFGAGAIKPPAGGLTQIARPVKGLARVLNPVGASGGADADQPKDVRRNGPASALTLGRSVSLADFEAAARSFGGVVNVSAGWAWDTRRQRAVVKLWYIADGGDIADALRTFLVGQADPNLPVVAVAAESVPTQLIVDFQHDPRFERADVQAALVERLANRETGLLAHANIPIAGALFRSALLREVMQVAGIGTVIELTVNGASAPVAMTAGEGRFLDFLPFSNT